MRAQNHEHLQDEQILWALIDETELGEDVQQHLIECQHCKGRVARFSYNLQEFGDKARQAVPPYSGSVKLPAAMSSKTLFTAGWLPFFGAAAMAVLIVFFYFMGLNTVNYLQLSPLQGQESLLEDEVLMREISELVESPLSGGIYEIIGENGSGYDEDFLDFVVPEIQDDFQS